MKFFRNCFLTICLSLASCAYHSKYGKCIGFLDKPEPTLEYEVSAGNAFWTIVGFEMIVPPIVWATSCVKCPVGVKALPMSCVDPLDEKCLRLSLEPR